MKILGKTSIKGKPAVDLFIYPGKNYFLIAIPIVLFNLVVIFGLHVLLGDDPSRYYRAVQGSFPFKFWEKGLFLCSITEWISWNIMVISPQLIRAIYVLILLVCLSRVMNKFFKEKLGFPPIVAYTSAILPCILPGQYLIPAFINGSYIMIGFLAMMGCFFSGFKYLDMENQKGWRILLVSVLYVIISTQFMDQAIFFLPVLLVAIFGYHKLNRKHLFLALSYSIAIAYKVIWILVSPREAAKMVNLSESQMLTRSYNLFFSMAPLPSFLKPYKNLCLILFVAIIITGFVLYLRDRDGWFNFSKAFTHLSHKQFIIYIYGFLTVWTVSNIVVYITISAEHSVRYSFIAGFGFNALFIISLYIILKKIMLENKVFIYSFFILILLFSGIFRFLELNTYFDNVNKNQAQIKNNLSSFKFPMNSQIVIYLANIKSYGGVWAMSSGHLKYMLRRNDINGLIGMKSKVHYFNFYNPFNTKLRGWEKNALMNGLRIDLPLFLFFEENNKFKQYEYALQWKGISKNSPWAIFRVDKITGQLFPLVSGVGMEEYVSTLQELKKRGILQSEILWGGPPTKEEQIRLDKGT
jgi:hypothetical protein